jgi:Flp pilus assembly protein CpaB
MNKNFALIIAMLLGVVAVALMFSYIKKSIDAKTAGWDMASVLVAAEDLPAGVTLSAQNTAARSYPSKYVSDRTIEPSQAQLVIGSELLTPAEKGKPILWTDVKPPTEVRNGLSADLQPGTRAVTIPVTQLSSFDGMLRPGMRVDVLWTGEESFFTPPPPPAPAAEDKAPAQAPDAASVQAQMSSMQRKGEAQAAAGKARKTLLLLQDVPVVAIGDQRNAARLQSEKPEPFATATLMVDELSARVLVHASGAGAVSLVLRRVGDTEKLQGPVVMGPDELAAFLARPLE